VTGGFDRVEDRDESSSSFVVRAEPARCDDRWSSEAVVPALPAWPPDEVCVAEAMPNDAPRAPTIPRPASPAWSLLLRWREVMHRRCVGYLCRTCERGEPPVSVP
jgi:hypothetical protein